MVSVKFFKVLLFLKTPLSFEKLEDPTSNLYRKVKKHEIDKLTVCLKANDGIRVILMVELQILH